MNDDRATTVAFSGHRTYKDDAADALSATIEELYGRGFRTFLCGMAVGFDLAAAEAVLECRRTLAGGTSSVSDTMLSQHCGPIAAEHGLEADPVTCQTVVERPVACITSANPIQRQPTPVLPRLVAVVPFQGQERRFPMADRERFTRVLGAADQILILSEHYHPGCYAVRNNYLVDHASLLVTWYDGSAGGTHYTVQKALRKRLELVNLCETAPGANPGLPAPEPTLF